MRIISIKPHEENRINLGTIESHTEKCIYTLFQFSSSLFYVIHEIMLILFNHGKFFEKVVFICEKILVLTWMPNKLFLLQIY